VSQEQDLAGDVTELDQVLIDELEVLEGAMARNYAWAYDVIAPYLGRSILEAGSGVGVISRYLVERGDPVVLTDHHPAYLAHLRARFGDRPNVAFQILDLEHPPFEVEQSIDTVVSLNVLEHIRDDVAAVRGLADLLPVGGRLVLQVPNYPSLFGSLDETYGHFRRYSKRSLLEVIEQAGLSLVEIRNFNPLAIPGWVVSAKILRMPRVDVRSARLFNRIVPLARRLDFLSALGGLALIVCAERRG